MKCETFAASLGHHCAPLPGGGIVVTTPFTMPNGTSIPVYIEPIAGDQYRLWDAGELLFEAIVSGAHLPDRRRLRGLAAPLQQLGAKITESGALELFAPADALAQGFACFIEAALEVARWNERILFEPADHDDLVDEVHQLLTAVRPKENIERGVTVEGLSRRPLSFDFRQGAMLVDCIAGTANASAFEVRKLLDLRSLSAHAETEVLVIVDDRLDPAKAGQEMTIVSRLATAQGFSALLRSAGAITTLQ